MFLLCYSPREAINKSPTESFPHMFFKSHLHLFSSVFKGLCVCLSMCTCVLWFFEHLCVRRCLPVYMSGDLRITRILLQSSAVPLIKVFFLNLWFKSQVSSRLEASAIFLSLFSWELCPQDCGEQ